MQRLRDARDGRDKSRLFIEGLKLAAEALSSGAAVRQFFLTRALEASAAGAALLRSLGALGVPGFLLDDQVMGFVSDLETPPGLILLADRPARDLAALLRARPDPLFVVLDALQLPSNVGAVVRTAEAAGAHGVLQAPGGADPLGPKALRASAGSAFRLPVLTGKPFAEMAEEMAGAGLRCVLADPRGDILHTEWDWRPGTALFLGAEARGTSSLEQRRPDLPRVRIPLLAPVESLNVAVCAGVLLYEAQRQRAAKEKPKEPKRRGRNRS